MVYQPITEEKKAEWVTWLQELKNRLDGRPEEGGTPETTQVFAMEVGDVATAKDLTGNLLALLTQEEVTIS